MARNGEWSESQQICQDKITCPVKGPDVEGDGNTFCYGNSPGSVCEIMCPIGYELVGDDKATCGEDGVWQGNFLIIKQKAFFGHNLFTRILDFT